MVHQFFSARDAAGTAFWDSNSCTFVYDEVAIENGGQWSYHSWELTAPDCPEGLLPTSGVARPSYVLTTGGLPWLVGGPTWRFSSVADGHALELAGPLNTSASWPIRLD